MFVPEVMHLKVWTALMRLELVFPRHPVAAPWARDGEIHVNHALLSTQVSHAFYVLYQLKGNIWDKQTNGFRLI